ncbi:unnamed protein product [Schistosoma rodhaini]|nr:unnamed protein product [Schistosoma rodhaini]
MDLDVFGSSEWNYFLHNQTTYSSTPSTVYPRMSSERYPEIPPPNSPSESSVDSSTAGCTAEETGPTLSEYPGQSETNFNQIPGSEAGSFSDQRSNNATAPFSNQQGYTNPSYGNNPSATSYVPGTTSFNIDYASQMQSPYIAGNPTSQNFQTNYFPTPLSFQSTEFSGSCRVYGFAESAPHEDIMKPTLGPKQDFCVEHDCKRLKKAMDRLKTKESVIIEVMGRRPVVQRVAILQKYESLYKENLPSKFSSELAGYLKDCLIALCFTPAEFDAIELRRAMRGPDTDEDTIIEILCSRTNEHIKRIKNVYPKLFNGRDLEDDVNSDSTNHFKHRNHVQRDVEELMNTVKQDIRIDESKFFPILAARSYAHLRVVFNEYMRIGKYSMEDTLKFRMSGNTLSALLSIVRCIQNKPRYFAEKLLKAMQHVEADDTTLIRIIVSRCEIDLKNILKEFYKMTRKTLDECICFDNGYFVNEVSNQINLFIDPALWNRTPSNYRRLLLKLIRG